ncbi:MULTISPECIES: hypothetical protein [Mesoflavibacter]|uniref:Bulb-type lectin domain-containing protein n=1 Tax=Mesoflavibacter profundi TaxID=2708110 RepID=A0ABT4S1G8_9FLAO|nr:MULTISPECIES: hypothetical protein [Mesoflavibacter]MDA0177748.1 hypothetical protein [Mesoflavibacter profundi]QIJ88708.1 hypothetical protein C7H62_0899 [Mesoflavibacter sp. HG96]QIJ91436.1 hypothetical protein C7H56_0899 [Mesoflavibacter sp. HG37]
MKKLYTLLILTLLISSCKKDDAVIIEEPNTSTFETTGALESVLVFGGSLNESAETVIKTSDGGYAVLGFTQSTDGDITDKTDSSYDVWLLRFDQDNNLLWNKTYGGTNDEKGHDLIQTEDGGFAVIGYTFSNDGDVDNNAGQQDFWLFKTDAQGNLQWEKTYGYSGLDYGLSIKPANDNGFILSGVLDVTSSGGEGNTRQQQTLHAGGDYWVLKVDQTGNLIWSKYFGGLFTDTAYDVIPTNDNGFIIIGSSDSEDTDISNNIGSYDFWAVKVDNQGVLQWEQNYGGTQIDEAYKIIKTNNNNYLIVGDTRSEDEDISNTFGAADVWAITISEDGNLINQNSYGGENFDVSRSVISDSENGFLICGSSRSGTGQLTQNNGQNDIWVLKTNATGHLKWQTSIGGSNVDFAYGITQLNNNKIITVGETSSDDFDIPENKGFTDLIIVTLN